MHYKIFLLFFALLLFPICSTRDVGLLDSGVNVSPSLLSNNSISEYKSVIELNKQLIDISTEKVGIVSKVVAVFGVGKAVEKKQRLISTSLQRREAMLALAEKNPGLFLSLAIPEKVQSARLKEVSPYLEHETVQTGILEIQETPHFDNTGKSLPLVGSGFQYYLHENNATYEMKFTDSSIPRDFTGGDKVKVAGVVLGEYLVTSSALSGALELATADPSQRNIDVSLSPPSPRREENFGTQRIAIILTKAPGEPDPDVSLLNSHMQKVNDYFREVSYGQVNLTWDVYGQYVSQDSPGTNVLIRVADADINFSKYSRIISVDNRNCFGCAFIGMTESPTNEGVVNIAYTWVHPSVFQSDSFYSVLEHELGHNFGVFHANLLDCGDKYIDRFENCMSWEYGDFFDVMGSNIYSYATGHINSLHKEIITWIGEDRVREVTASGDYLIRPFEVLSIELEPYLALKVPRKIDENGISKDFYYLEYRTSIGQDSFIPASENGVQVRIFETLKNGPGYSPSQHIPLHGRSYYPYEAQINISESFFDPLTQVNITVLETNSQFARVHVEISNQTCIRKEPLLRITPSMISGASSEMFYYDFELINTDEGICDDRNIYFNESNSFYFIPKVTGAYIFFGSFQPTRISSGEKISGVLAVFYPQFSTNFSISLVDVLRGTYAHSTLSINVTTPSFTKIDFGGEDRAKRFLYSPENGYYLIDKSGKVYRRGITHFTTENGPTLSNENKLVDILSFEKRSSSIVLLSSNGSLYGVGEPINSNLLYPLLKLPGNTISIADVISYESTFLIAITSNGYTYFYSYSTPYEISYNCLTSDGKNDAEVLGKNISMMRAPQEIIYILTKEGEFFACSLFGHVPSPYSSFMQFNQPLPVDLGTNDRYVVSFDVLEKEDKKGIVLVDSYGDVYTTGNITYQGSPSFGYDIARDIKITPDGLGYGILKGTGEIYECRNGTCSVLDESVNCNSDIECNDNNNYTLDVCMNSGTTTSYCEHDAIQCIINKDCNDENTNTVDTCINPGKKDSYCQHKSTSDCADSDGFDITVKGSVNYSGITYQDICINYQEVLEHTCSLDFSQRNKEVKTTVRQCQNQCIDGACIQQDKQIQRICSDTDTENTVSVFGQVTFKGTVYTDSCAEQGLSVRQYFCADDKLRNFVKRCPSGMSCSNGVCR